MTVKYLGRFSENKLRYLWPGSKPFTAISLFSGCGGAALGVMQAGFDVRVFVEIDKYACQTLRRNWTDDLGKRTVPKKYRKWQGIPAIIQEDITKVSTSQILKAAKLRVGEVSLLEGGFPCQGFSTASTKRDKNNYKKDKRNFLYLECVRVIREALPKTFFLENVPGLVSMENGRVIRMIIDDLSKCGYTINWDILNAANYGVPQNRKRVFILGKRVDLMELNGKKVICHIGAVKGGVTHPAWFLKKYDRK